MSKPWVIAVVADEVKMEFDEEGQLLVDSTFMNPINVEDRNERPWGFLLGIPDSITQWDIVLFHPHGGVYKQGGAQELQKLLAPSWLPECIFLAAKPSLDQIRRACNFSELDLQVEYIKGDVKTALNS